MRGWLLLPSAVFVGAAIASSCTREQVAYRGAGLQVATHPLHDQVEVYRAVLGASFTLGDPSLSLLADPILLPRTDRLTGGDTMPPDLLSSLRGAGLVLGTCRVPIQSTRVPLLCQAERAGYVVRLSAPFVLGPDSVQVHLVAQQYAIPGGPRAERLRFERAYHVVRRGAAWRAVREARLAQP